MMAGALQLEAQWIERARGLDESLVQLRRRSSYAFTKRGHLPLRNGLIELASHFSRQPREGLPAVEQPIKRSHLPLEVNDLLVGALREPGRPAVHLDSASDALAVDPLEKVVGLDDCSVGAEAHRAELDQRLLERESNLGHQNPRLPSFLLQRGRTPAPSG